MLIDRYSYYYNNIKSLRCVLFGRIVQLFKYDILVGIYTIYSVCMYVVVLYIIKYICIYTIIYYIMVVCLYICIYTSKRGNTYVPVNGYTLHIRYVLYYIIMYAQYVNVPYANKTKSRFTFLGIDFSTFSYSLLYSCILYTYKYIIYLFNDTKCVHHLLYLNLSDLLLNVHTDGKYL